MESVEQSGIMLLESEEDLNSYKGKLLATTFKKIGKVMSYSYLSERRTLSEFLHIQIKRLSLLGGRSVKEVIHRILSDLFTLDLQKKVNISGAKNKIGLQSILAVIKGRPT